MAKSFSEIKKKAENLIEQGHEADRKVQSCQANVASANNRVAVARRQLAAASMTDSEGNPMGDVGEARVQLAIAQGQLAASQRALSAAQGEANRIKQQKNAHIHEIESHNKTGRSNLDKISRLESLSFGSNAASLAEGIAKRHNEAEDARVALLKSMGMEASAEYVDGVSSGESGARWSGLSYSSIDTSGQAESYKGGNSSEGIPNNKALGLPIGTALGGLVNGIGNFLHMDRDTNDNSYENVQYSDVSQLSDEVYKFAADYQADSGKYNNPLRNNSTSDEIEQFRKIINSHRIQKDTIFYRRASVNDLGESLIGVPIEELKGRCYQFKGIMSASGEIGIANSVSNQNVVFEIKVPAGTSGLDLTNVTYFREAMIDSPFCIIEGVRVEGNTTHLKIRILDAGDGINRVNTFESLENYMNSRHEIHMDNSVRNLDITTVKAAISGIESVIKEYPDVGKFLKNGYASDEGVMSCSGDSLSFNPQYFSDEATLPITCNSQSDRHGWIRNASVSSIGVHEAGHGVEWALIQANSKYVSQNDRVMAWNKCTESSKIVKQACENLKNSPYGSEMLRTEMVRSISYYAMTNASETMAEAFADVYANGENATPLSKEIKKLTNEYIKLYKGGD